MPARKRPIARALHAIALVACAIGVLSLTTHPLHAADAQPPRRVVSMNLCTDQLLLLLADPRQIRSVSYVSHDPTTSVMSAAARRHPPNHGLAEEIFLMRPDLILSGAFTRLATTDLLRRLGFRVETFLPAQSFADIRANIVRLGALLGRNAESARMLAEFDRALAAVTLPPSAAPKPRAALYYANSYTSGSGTLAADIAARAGLDNIATNVGLDGMVRLPLEVLVIGAPDVIIAEQRDSEHAALAYETFAHPALRAAAGSARAVVHTDVTWACGAPFTIDAIRRLRAATQALPTSKRER